MEIMCLPVNRNYITTGVTIPLIIYVTFSIVLFLYSSHNYLYQIGILDII